MSADEDKPEATQPEGMNGEGKSPLAQSAEGAANAVKNMALSITDDVKQGNVIIILGVICVVLGGLLHFGWWSWSLINLVLLLSPVLLGVTGCLWWINYGGPGNKKAMVLVAVAAVLIFWFLFQWSSAMADAKRFEGQYKTELNNLNKVFK